MATTSQSLPIRRLQGINVRVPFFEVDKVDLSVLKENTFSLSVRLKEEMTDEVFYNHCNDLIVYFIYFVKSLYIKELGNL